MELQHIADYPLSSEDIDWLTSIVRGSESFVVRTRAHAVLLLFKGGRSFDDVADIFDVHPNTVRNWAERWVSYRIDGLYDQPGRGAKPMFDKSEIDLVVKCVEEEPRSLRAAVPEIEKMTNKRPSLDTLRGILKNRGKSWKRERKIPKGKPTKEEYERGVAEIEELVQLAHDGEFKLVYFDVAGFCLTPQVPYAWQDRGRHGTLGLPTTGSKRINELGFLDPAANTLRTFARIGSVNSDVIIDAMETYCDDLQDPTVVLLDNASIHRSEAVQEKLPDWEKRGLTLYFLPRYSPQLNLIEMLWRKMKYQWMPPWAYTGFTALQEALYEIVRSYGVKYKIQFSQWNACYNQLS